MSLKYEQRVESALTTYEVVGCPEPHYLALFTLLPGARPKLSRKGLQNYQMLAEQVGYDHLHMFGVEAVGRVGASTWKIKSYQLKLPLL
jgi:hypothetical protein